MILIIKNGLIINRGKSYHGDILVKDGKIEQVGGSISREGAREYNAEGKWVLPGIIDDQVHFREPGLTHKADIASESRAAVAGGVTSFMEMPNTKPPAVTQKRLQEKYDAAASCSPANYSFFMGASNENLEEVLRTNAEEVCGIKVFMGSSTGNMLVDDETVLNNIFRKSDMLIATHCESEPMIRASQAKHEGIYGDDIPIELHPVIRSAEACYASSSMAIELAKAHNARLHILHISTEIETGLFDNTLALEEKRITSEVCVHHLHFTSSDYRRLGTKIKCNPAIKTETDKAALWKALLDDRLDIIATDHAPHTEAEKNNVYTQSPSGLPLVQHALNMMYQYVQSGTISMERVVEKMCHAPSTCFNIRDRGYIDPGYFADLVIFDPNVQWTVDRSNILYKCGWSPLEGIPFQGKVLTTFVNGEMAYHDGKVNTGHRGMRLAFKPNS